MIAAVEYLSNKASAVEIAVHLWTCDTDFVPPLSGRVEINDYAQKILSKALRFEAWSSGKLVGLVATYCNDQEKRIAYITSVSVLKEWTGKGIAACLMSRCIKDMKALGIRQVYLEVASDNTPAIRLYKRNGFVAGNDNVSFVTMKLNLKNGEEHGQ
jgi:ribosomal protein S18 acetylase RimI-like enzyme